MSRFRKLSQTVWHCQYHNLLARGYCVDTEMIRKYVTYQEEKERNPERTIH